jgi:hypothetical protein
VDTVLGAIKTDVLGSWAWLHGSSHDPDAGSGQIVIEASYDLAAAMAPQSQ